MDKKAFRIKPTRPILIFSTSTWESWKNPLLSLIQFHIDMKFQTDVMIIHEIQNSNFIILSSRENLFYIHTYILSII